jgi:hypothetical protein
MRLDLFIGLTLVREEDKCEVIVAEPVVCLRGD